MVDKNEYINKFREMYNRKTGEDLPESLALEYFEKLVVLVETLTVNNN